MEASQHSLLAACFTLHGINATLAIVPQRGAGPWISLGVKGGWRLRPTTLPPSVSRLSRQNVGTSTSHNPMGLHGLWQGYLYLYTQIHSVGRMQSFNTLKQVVYIVAYLLEARTVEPKKQPLLANGSEITFISRQRRPLLGSRFLISYNRRSLLKNGSVDTFSRQRIRIQEWTVLSARAVPRSYKEDNWDNRVSSVRESVKKRDSWKGATIHRRYESVKLKNHRC
jgi:hypothetical protein